MGVRVIGPPSRGATAAVQLLLRTVACGVVAWLALSVLRAGELQLTDALTREAGARMEQKILTILYHADTDSPEARPTPLPEQEINAFLRFQGASQLPVGITTPVVRIGDDEQVSAKAVVDLDAIRRQRTRGLLDLLQFLTGRLLVTASGTVRSGGGMAQVDIHSVSVAGIPVPVQVLRELVRYFTRTADDPEGTDMDAPIPLPYRIAELQLSPGLAVIVQ